MDLECLGADLEKIFGSESEMNLDGDRIHFDDDDFVHAVLYGPWSEALGFNEVKKISKAVPICQECFLAADLLALPDDDGDDDG